MPRMHKVVVIASYDYCDSKDSLERLARRISAKINDGDIAGPIHLAALSGAIAPHSPEALELLQAKHPPAPCNCSVPVFDDVTSEMLD